MKLPEPVWRLLLVVMVVVFVGVLYRDVSAAPKGPDYCAMGNFRTCRVDDRGEWIRVTTPDGQHMIYIQNGKVVGVQ